MQAPVTYLGWYNSDTANLGRFHDMLTSITVRKFKQFENVTVDLDDVIVFVGPNDSGKTTALQALSLWELGLRRWHERWGMVPTSDMQRPGVSINRLDLFSVPVNHANQLWRGLRTREAKGQKPGTSNVRIEIEVQGELRPARHGPAGLNLITLTQSLSIVVLYEPTLTDNPECPYLSRR